MPVGIEGEPNNIVINLFHLQTGQQCIQLLHIIDICIVYSYEYIFAGIRCCFPDSLAAGGQKLSHICHIRFTGHTIVDLISDLYHAHIDAGFQNLSETVQCVVVESIRFFFNIHALPCLGNELLLRIRPKIGIMEIDADLHAILRSTLTQGNCGCYVVVTAAVTVTVLIIGIIPDTETDIVHTGLCQRHKYILFFPVEIIIFYAAVLQSQYCRGVHAPVKIIGNAVDRLHIDGRTSVEDVLADSAMVSVVPLP